MNIKIGPYTLSQRTKYSKIQIFNESGENITNEPLFSGTVKKILEDYDKCLNTSIFNVVDNELLGFQRKDDGKDIEYLFLPDGISCIYNAAFENASMKYLYIPDTVKIIGSTVFHGCVNLKEVDIPDSVEYICYYSFGGCKDLRKATLSKNTKEISAYAFSACGKLEEIILPDKIKEIGAGAFGWCQSLKRINIPKDIESFGICPFAGSGIKTIIFNSNTKKESGIIDSSGGFLEDSAIYKIEIGENVTKINKDFFKNSKKAIKEIDYMGDNKGFERFRKENKSFINSLRHPKINIKESFNIESSKSNEKNIEIER